MFNLIYAEKHTDTDTEQGVFLSIAEFAEYRRCGWESTEQWNAAADAYLSQRDDDSRSESMMLHGTE